MPGTCGPIAHRLTDVPVKIFWGTRYDTPLFRDAVEIPVPVGRRCGYCNQRIEAGSNGCLQGFFRPEDGSPTYLPAHLECHVRATLGSPAHIAGTCKHGTGEELEEGADFREMGREVLKRYLEGWTLWDNGSYGPPPSCA